MNALARSSRLVFPALFLLLGAAFGAALALGTVRVNPMALFGPDPVAADGAREIILNLRLPRALAAIIAGGCLSVSGALFQGVFRNPLVEPYTLGVSGGAVLGVALATILGLGHPAVQPFFALGGACASVFLVLALTRGRGEPGVPAILLTGLMLSFMSGAVLMLVMALVRADQMQQIFYWTMGNLAGVRPALLPAGAAAALVASGAAWRMAPTLNALALGDEPAHHLGVRVARARKTCFFLGSLLAALAVSLGGIIGFVGLLIPHAMRFLLGADARRLLPAAFLAGGIFLLLADLLARTIIAPLELPVGVITGIVGGTLFIALLHRRKNRL